MKRAFVALGVLFMACSPSADARFAAAESRANALTSAGKHDEAARRWLEAADRVESPADRDEALYRAASSYERAGNAPEALRLYERLERGQGERAARASFDRARLVRKSDAARGETLLVAAIRRHPTSGLAPRAVREHLERTEVEQGAGAALEEASRLLRGLETTELDETLRYERGRLLERSESFREARDAFLETAARHPYPKGALWDDALARASRCEEHLGRPLAAIALLERLLAERESSWKIASYDRAGYAQARFHVAEIYRDTLDDPERARREFRRVYAEHPTSVLRDDALWQEALVARALGDQAGTCAPLGLLVEHLPDSRFAPCAQRLCSSLVGGDRRDCRTDVREPDRAPGPPVNHSSSSSSSSSSSP
jgi:tetratricopeptide (TPR) repeat protein